MHFLESGTWPHLTTPLSPRSADISGTYKRQASHSSLCLSKSLKLLMIPIFSLMRLLSIQWCLPSQKNTKRCRTEVAARPTFSLQSALRSCSSVRAGSRAGHPPRPSPSPVHAAPVPSAFPSSESHTCFRTPVKVAQFGEVAFYRER